MVKVYSRVNAVMKLFISSTIWVLYRCNNVAENSLKLLSSKVVKILWNQLQDYNKHQYKYLTAN